MVDWEGAKSLIPAEVRMFFRFESDNKHYAVIHSCHDCCTKHSVLTCLWIKEYKNNSRDYVNNLFPYSKNDSCEDKEPLLRVIPCEAIHSHCLLMPLSELSQQ